MNAVDICCPEIVIFGRLYYLSIDIVNIFFNEQPKIGTSRTQTCTMQTTNTSNTHSKQSRNITIIFNPSKNHINPKQFQLQTQ